MNKFDGLVLIKGEKRSPSRFERWRRGLRRWWCGIAHRKIGYIGSGEYECRICQERFSVPWKDPDAR